ncbi:hypothetical protein L226DRAFT_573887 [Lentinus tigrinus ALCF2SS1-7]|uniref:uncharacterized protein n=1 Tax=Lentinus tigrinus ALCF2SS1-7 TaxID=1328758 RepID=UPI001165D0EE|nr:hypothetical protein L226DRAFT_573887 [Lentinus tigrinus ALCF2SS1-7]
MVATTRRKAKENACLVFHRFPPEVLLMVLEQLSDDKSSLLSCCLVSHFWLSAGRSFLFRTVTIHSKKDGPDNFDAFLRFLTRSGVGKHIWGITLSAPPLPEVTSPDEDMDAFVSAHYTPCSIDTVFRILHHTFCLRHLALQLLRLTSTSASSISSPSHPHRPTLDCLSFDDCVSDEDVRPLFDLICLFADIGTLTIAYGPSVKAVPEGTLFGQRRCLPLIHRLEMYGENEATTYGTFELLRRSGSLDRALTQIELETTLGNVLTPFLTFLPEAATHLVHLNLIASNVFYEPPYDISYPPPFPFFPALRRLELDIDLDADSYPPLCSRYVHRVIDVYADLLSTPSSFPVLSRLDFHIDPGTLAPEILEYSAHWPIPVWHRLDEALMALPSIEMIIFELKDIPESMRGPLDPLVNRTTGSFVHYFFSRHMPAMYAKEIYQVVHDQEAAGYESDSESEDEDNPDGAPTADAAQG